MRARVLVLLAITTAIGCASRVEHVLAPVAEPDRDTAACASCHAEIDAEWRDSLHRRAWTNPVFQEGYAIEPEASCRGCHAPRMDEGRADDGIDCASCHTSRPHEAPLPTEASSCATCHEFRFPRDGLDIDETQPLIQATYAEWERSAHARRGTRCQDCHMPIESSRDGTAHRSHRFGVVERPEVLRDAVALEVDAVRDGRFVRVEARLARVGVGHAVPTGDPFRRLELRLSYAGREHLDVLGRTFRGERHVDASGRIVTLRMPDGDTRLGAPGTEEPRVLSWRVPRGAEHQPLEYELVYVRASRADDESPSRRVSLRRGSLIPREVP